MASVSLGTFIVACACATLGLMISISFLVFHIYHRTNKIVKMSSPYMNMITSFGAILMSVVCFLYGLDFILEQEQNTRTTICQIRVWVIVTSITLILGPVCTKAWRVHSIFKFGFAKKVVIKDSKLMTIIGGLLAVDITLMALWQTIDPVSSKTKIYAHLTVADGKSDVHVINETESIQECSCEKLPVWIIVLTLWKITLLISCLIFAWKTKGVTVPCLNDAANTFAAIFVSIMITLCATMAATSLHKNTDATYIITAISMAACIFLFQLAMFLPKVQYWWKTPDDASPKISSSSLREIASAEIPPFHLRDENANTYSDDGLLNIVEENKALKESLLEKEGLISALQDHLDHAKEKLTKLPTNVGPKADLSLDLDAASGIYDILRSPDQLLDRSGMYRVEGTPRSAESGETNDVTGSQNETDQSSQQQTNLKYVETQSYHSIGSRRSFVEEFTDIRKSIEAELDSATFINSDLKNSLSADLERPYSETEWLYESNAAPELAGSIVQSYNLGENQNAFSFIQSCLPRENSVFQIKRSRRSSVSSAMSMPSSENVSTKSAEADNISFEVTPTLSRDSATPNSQQHADILRYYSYRHMNDGFKRFQTYRVNRNVRPPSFKRFRRNVPSISFRTKDVTSVMPTKRDDTPAIYSVPNVLQKPPRVFKDTDWPKDSFV